MKKIIFIILFLHNCFADSEPFNFKFYEILTSNNEDKNIFFSSYSLQVALSMLSEGSKKKKKQNSIIKIIFINKDVKEILVKKFLMLAKFQNPQKKGIKKWSN